MEMMKTLCYILPGTIFTLKMQMESGKKQKVVLIMLAYIIWKDNLNIIM